MFCTKIAYISETDTACNLLLPCSAEWNSEVTAAACGGCEGRSGWKPGAERRAFCRREDLEALTRCQRKQPEVKLTQKQPLVSRGLLS